MIENKATIRAAPAHRNSKPRIPIVLFVCNIALARVSFRRDTYHTEKGRSRNFVSKKRLRSKIWGYYEPVMGLILSSLARSLEASSHSFVIVFGGGGAVC